MRFLIGIVLIAGLGWSAYWYAGALSLERGMESWFEERRTEGWAVNTADIETQGFPNRFDTTLTDIELADPETGVAWRAPLFQILMLSYKTSHIIAVWPDTQTVATPQETVSVTSRDMRASAVFEPGSDRAIDRITVTFEGIALASTADWTGAIANGRLAMRRIGPAANRYEVAFDARDLALPGKITRALADRGLVSGALGQLSMAATFDFDAPWDIHALQDRRPQPTSIDLDNVAMRWGELDLRIAGKLDIDSRGRPDGEIAIKATNWREILDLIVDSGVLPPGWAPLIERGLDTLSGLAGNPRTLDIPLSFEQGRMRLAGIVPLGEAPRLSLR